MSITLRTRRPAHERIRILGLDGAARSIDIVAIPLPSGTFEVGSFRVDTELICHPNPTLGVRIDDGRHVLAYMPDHEPALGLGDGFLDNDWTSGAATAFRADVLIHDAQYTDGEYADRVGWGHRSYAHTFELARRLEVTAPRSVARRRDPRSPVRRSGGALRAYLPGDRGPRGDDRRAGLLPWRAADQGGSRPDPHRSPLDARSAGIAPRQSSDSARAGYPERLESGRRGTATETRDARRPGRW